MKKLIYIFLGLCLMTSCTKDTYADEQEAEQSLIKEYINRESITVLNKLPDDSVSFAENEYYKSPSGMYYHLVSSGDRGKADADTISVGDRVVMRYKKWRLENNSDTIRYWTTTENAYPLEFQYLYSSVEACTAWHEAIGYMRYNNAEAVIIVPGDLGFSDDSNPKLTPYCYRLKIKFQK